MNPAQRVIEKCGGVAIVAEIAGVHPSRVHRWTYPKDRGGTGGVIPSLHQQKILDGAVARSIALRPEDFFDLADTSQRDGDTVGEEAAQ